MIIYLVTNLLNKKEYVGQSTQSLESRWHFHKTCGLYKKGPIISKAIIKYGAESFIIKVIDAAATQEELNEKERYWIKKLNTLSPNGYNLTTGGQSGGRHLQKTKKKISKKLQGRYFSPETKEKITKAKIGHVVDTKTRQKISNTLKGLVVGEDHSGSKLTEKQVLEIKKLLQERNLSQKEIAKIFKINRSVISKINTGNTWKYLGAEEGIRQTLSKKLTVDQVIEIKKLLQEGNISQRKISKIFNVCQGTIWSIQHNRTWADI